MNEYNENYVVEDMNEIDKIHAAREFVYTNSVFANGEDVLLNGFSQEIFGLTKKEKVVKMFELIKNYKGGLYCDGLADMLAIFLQCMGYDAYRVNLNVYESTHCVTVVKYGEGWLIEDATFNYTYVLKDKEMYDLKTLIYNLKI